MLADPITMSFNGVSTPMPRTKFGAGDSLFTSVDGHHSVAVKQTTSKNRRRHEFRVSQNKISADPFIPAQNVALGASVYLVVDEPVAGFTAVELQYLFNGLVDVLYANSFADFNAVVLGEY